MCVICSKIKFIIITTYVTETHIFCFYNKRHTFITTDITLQNTYILSKLTLIL